MWTLFYGRFGDLQRAENFERCLHAMLAYKHVAYLDPDEHRIRREFPAGPQTYAGLFALIHRHHAERVGKPRWGDQTGLVEGYADEILGSDPATLMIHMLRDPRDRYDASLALWPEGRLRVGGAVGRWLYSARLAQENARRHPDRYLVVRYEDLVVDPDAVARMVCDFLGEDYRPELLELRGMPSYREKLLAQADAPTRDGASPLITARFVGSFHGRLPARELTFLEARAGNAMRHHGYTTEDVALKGIERLRYALVDLPLNLVRMKVWQLRNAAGRRLPAIAGRRPSARYLVRDVG
jgi:hypothetical protein